MSLIIRELHAADPKKRDRSQLIELRPPIEYEDGRTKQCHRDECDISKIMSSFDVTGTISHLQKYEGVYADFSDFDFHHQSNMLAKGASIFADLPAELRQEFGQSPEAFFRYVNNPENHDDLRKKLPALAKPGQQLPRTTSPDANLEAADAAANTTEGEASADLRKVLQDAIEAIPEPPEPPAPK